MAQPPFLSYSQISIYERCAAAYRYLYIEGRKRKSTAAADFGIAVHAIIAEAYERMVQTKYAGPLRGEMFYPGGAAETLARKGVTGRDNVSKMTRQLENLCYFEKHVFDYEQVAGIELEFMLKLKGLGKPIKGYIDHVHRERGTSTLVVVDYKTGRPPVEAQTKEHWPVDTRGAQGQLQLYAVPASMMCGGDHQAIRIEVWYLEGPIKFSQTFGLVVLDVIEKEWARRGVRLTREKVWAYTAGEHCVWCDVRATCPEYARLRP